MLKGIIFLNDLRHRMEQKHSYGSYSCRLQRKETEKKNNLISIYWKLMNTWVNESNPNQCSSRETLRNNFFKPLVNFFASGKVLIIQLLKSPFHHKQMTLLALPSSQSRLKPTILVLNAYTHGILRGLSNDRTYPAQKKFRTCNNLSTD